MAMWITVAPEPSRSGRPRHLHLAPDSRSGGRRAGYASDGRVRIVPPVAPSGASDFGGRHCFNVSPAVQPTWGDTDLLADVAGNGPLLVGEIAARIAEDLRATLKKKVAFGGKSVWI